MQNKVKGFVERELNELFNSGSSIITVTHPIGTTISDLIDSVLSSEDEILEIQGDVSDLEAISHSHPVTKQLYVDGGRSDTYVEDGSVSYPFKTIQAAIDQIIDNDDNSIYPYSIHMASWLYAENIVLEDLKLHHIDLIGDGIVRINPTSGNALQSTANNTNLVDFHCQNIIFAKPFVITGANASAAFADVFHTNCSFVLDGAITLTCVNNFGLRGCYSEQPITLNNVNYQYHESSHLQGDMAFNFDSAADMPSWGESCLMIMNGCYESGNVTFSVAGTATFAMVLNGCRVSSTGATIPAGVTIHNYNSYVRGTWVNNGNIVLRGGFFQAITPGTGSVMQTAPSSQILYTAATPANWSVEPTNVNDAVDKLADTVTALNGGPISASSVLSVVSVPDTSYELEVTDGNKLIIMTSSSNSTLDVPDDATTPIPLNTKIDVIQGGTGTVTITPAVGVTIESKGGNMVINGRFVAVTLIKINTDLWYLFGDLTS